MFFSELQAGSTTAWTATLVLFVALAELVAANIAALGSRSGARRAGGLLGGIARFVARLVVVFVFVAGMWVLIAGGAAERMGEVLASQFQPPMQRATVPMNHPANEGVVVARKRLKELAPQVYRTVSNLNTPSIHPESKSVTSYTWSYTPSDSSVPASFTLTLDSAGNVVTP